MKIETFTQDTYSIYEKMALDFYSGGATISTPDTSIFKRNFDHILEFDDVIANYIVVDGEYAGYYLMSYMFSTEVGGTCLWIEELYIKEEYQGQGLGTKVLQDIIKNNPNIQRFRLEVTPNNKGAYKLYETLGFKELSYDQMILDK